MVRKVRTEILCHQCETLFSVDFDVDKNGNHVVDCPNCEHEHCRVIENGRVTSARWDSRNLTYRYSAAASATTANMYNSVYANATTSTADDCYPGSWILGRSI